jgi:hypothetical protein
VKPALLVIAGPNGGGKTTVTARLREERWSEGVEYLNPDEIARDRFGDWNSPEAVLAAARWTDARREELLAAGSGIAFETVLSTASKIDFLESPRLPVGLISPRVWLARSSSRDSEVMPGARRRGWSSWRSPSTAPSS